MGIVGGALGFYVQGTTTTRRRRLDSLMSLTSAKTITPISYHRPSKYKDGGSIGLPLFSHLDGRSEKERAEE
jgi:hypothetical protein